MKKYKPTSPSRRKYTGISYSALLSGDEKEKKLTRGIKRSVGRNNKGRITTRHKGAGNKKLWREVDFKYNKRDIPGTISTVEYDPNRTAFISIVTYADGEKRYIVSPHEVKVGDKIIVSENAEIKTGNRLILRNIPVGTFVYNIELKPEAGAALVRSGGSYAEVIAHDGDYALLKLPSSEVRKVPDRAWASVGMVSNQENYLVNLGKAGRSRWLGIRPTVRGSAMNPVDHPYGGGEGVSGRGRRRALSKWGKPTGIGQKTRKPKKYSNHLVVSRRKVGKRRK